jgi:hypothetical protein
MPLRKTYEAEVDPATVRVCHCTDCQTLTGTAFRTNISSLLGTFRLKTGTPKIYVKTAESGNKRAHGFCPECGTPIYATAPVPSPSTYGLPVGSIDQRAQFAPPARQIWCRSALHWSMDLRGSRKQIGSDDWAAGQVSPVTPVAGMLRRSEGASSVRVRLMIRPCGRVATEGE